MSASDGAQRPVLSIVVAHPGPDGAGSACLEALRPQVGADVEVIVVAAAPIARPVPHWFEELVVPGGLAPELWAAGVVRAEGTIVGLLSTAVAPGAHWVARTLAVHATGAAAVGGPIEPGAGGTLVDWALWFCRYAPYLPPLVNPEAVEVPADNASYLRRVLVRYRELYERSFLEPFLHDAMRADGHAVRMTSERTVRTLGGARATAFCRQRFLHGRAHGARRSEGQRRGPILRAALTAPLVPAVMTARAVASVMAKRRYRARCLASLPLMVAFYCCWAAGELVGRLETVLVTTRR